MKRRRLDNRECELLRKIGIINELGFPFTPVSRSDARRCWRLLRVGCLKPIGGGVWLTWRRGEIGACSGKRLWKEGFPIKNKRSRYELNRGNKSPWKRLETGTAGQVLVMNPITGPTWVRPTGRMKGKGPIITIDDTSNPIWKTP
jgi:hypothetical protein